jgi:hypothetical protein
MRTRLTVALALAALPGAWGVSAAQAGGSSPLGAGSATAFSFSGTLAQPNGSYDFQYEAYTAATGGSSVAGPVVVSGVRVTNSTYATTIDLRPDPFTGDARFLQIGWRPHGSGAFTQLAKRVELVATPYALGLRLPVTETGASFPQPLFSVNQSGAAPAIAGSSPAGIGVSGTSSAYYGVSGISSGGDGVFGQTNTSLASGVAGANTYTGPGVSGTSAQGTGGSFSGATGGSFTGTTGGASFQTTGGGATPAIKIGSGGIEDVGAGIDTPTFAFIHQVTSANLCAGGDFTILSNPYLDNNPNALVFLQINSFHAGIGSATLWPYYDWGAADCPTGHWEVSISDSAGARFWNVGDTFSVLVIDP